MQNINRAWKRARTSRLLTWPGLLLVLFCIVTPAIAAEWVPVSDMLLGRSDTNAVPLTDGRVLFGNELYDPSTGQWTSTQGSTSGYLATLTLLNDGRVLKAGHYDLFWSGALPYAQLFDPNSNSWSDTSNSNLGHGGHLAVRLADGKVLIAGNSRDGGTASEIFDPITATWTVTGNMNTSHVDGFIELLDNGKVIVGGGAANPFYNYDIAGIETYDPDTGNWTLQDNPPGFWRYPASVRLDDGRILVANQSRSYLYDATSDSWTAAADLNTTHAGGFLLTLLADGQVLIAGGFDLVAGDIGNAAEVYNPLADSWTRISDMPENRFDYGAALLKDGNVLLAGGSHTDPICCQLNSAILYTPSGTPEPPAMPPPPPPPPEPTPRTVSVSDLDGSSVAISKRRWQAAATITVSDDLGNLISNATVTGTWSGGYSGTTSCTTDNYGMCSVVTGNVRNSIGSTTFKVSNITHASLAYDSAANSDPDLDSNGTSITVFRP